MQRSWDRQLIIGISANAAINNNGQGIHAGMNAFLPKPITVKTLSELDCSTEVVHRTRQLDEFEGTSAQNYFDAKAVREQNLPVSLPSRQQQQLPSRQNTASQLACLIAADAVTAQRNPLPQQLESMGWNVVIVNDGIDCLELLKLQQWAAVLVEDNLRQLSGLLCISNFRKWEGINAIAHRQKNIFYVCDGEVPSPADGNSWIQPPIGFDGVLSKPVPWIDLQCMLMRSNDPQQNNISNLGLGYNFNSQG
jgi:CheY-like chemotaxis protein